MPDVAFWSRPAVKRGLTLVVLLLAAGGAAWWVGFAGCRHPDLNTRIAQRKLYQGNAARPPAGDAPATSRAPAAGTGTAPDPSPDQADFRPAEDWPRWRGPRGDGISREPLPDALPRDLKGREMWSADVGLGYSSPVAAAGRVYLFTLNNGREALTAFDAYSGKILWNEESEVGFGQGYAGTRATPALDGNDIITLGGTGELTCRDLPTGQRRWRANVLELTHADNLGYGTASSPLIAGDLIYVQGGKGGPVALAFRRDSGAVAWQSEARGTAGYAAPLLVSVEGTPQLIVFAGEALLGLDPGTGKTLWSEPWKTDYQVNAATPVFSGGRLFVTSDYGMGGLMLRLSAGGASREWARKDIKCKIQSPLLDGDRLYANSDGDIKCMSWPDGRILWSTRSDGPHIGDGGTLVRSGDKLLALSERGELSLLRTAGDRPEVLGGARAVEGDLGQIWSTPLLYGGRLYVKGEKEFICYDLSAAEK